MLRFRDCIDFGSVLACEEGEGGVYAKESLCKGEKNGSRMPWEWLVMMGCFALLFSNVRSLFFHFVFGVGGAVK